MFENVKAEADIYARKKHRINKGLTKWKIQIINSAARSSFGKNTEKYGNLNVRDAQHETGRRHTCKIFRKHEGKIALGDLEYDKSGTFETKG